MTSEIYKIIRDSAHTDAHLYVMSKLDKNCTVNDYANKYVQLWKNSTQRSKLAYTLKNCGDAHFDKLIQLLQNNTKPAISTFSSQRSWIYGVEAEEWENDFEPLMLYQAISLSSLRVKD